MELNHTNREFSGHKNIKAIDAAAIPHLQTILNRWLPDGRNTGSEYIALNPLREDRHRGSFKINILTGKWSDFATDDKGHGAVSLAAYIFNISKQEAAGNLAKMLCLKEVDDD
jgi:hypothetical protein